MKLNLTPPCFVKWVAASVLALTSLGGCQKYDDSQLRNLITDLQKNNSELQKSNEELQKQLSDIKSAESSINSDIKALNQLVSTLQTGNYITDVTALPDGSGYTIAFASGEPVTVHNGTDGAKGEDGLTPKISIGLYEGVYYWTLDGEWLTDDNGNKLPVTGPRGEKGEKGDKGETTIVGTDGVMPKVRINTATNEWEISTDGGGTWVSTGVKATGEKGEKGDTGATGAAGKDGTAGADGKDGVTPQFEIVDGNWRVSYDNGASWSNAGSATASCGIVGATVDEKTKTITLTLSDGTKIPISYSGGSSAGNPWEGKMEVVLIKAGTFTMGSPTTETDRESDETQHQVTLTKDFYMGKYEVTNAQFCEFLNEKGIGSDGKYATSDYGSQTLMGPDTEGVMYSDGKWSPQSGYDDYPVVMETWYGANEYAKWIGGALPTEAQWEYACRAGSTTAYCFGDNSYSLGDYAWYSSNSDNKTHPVGQKKPNAWGLYDMHGNVWEWCSDWYGNYPSISVTDPTGASSGSYRVIRGGSYHSASSCRSAYRNCDYPDINDNSCGFRVCFPSGSTI